ncbi:carbohydrate ABC transporter permease [Caloramator australicus]|uniref:Possible alpha-xyloside ABC transporter, permease component n=1 Tax=Caloramator australicus RC3 TaxID=857293 RepID=G0V3V9_9CLOT|nr:sugar ABC transporter permease [Caloramator australicus]CCC57799.1 Possible alpha-xyloside ABC transporter, permease component [Caloramator australicus RC3]
MEQVLKKKKHSRINKNHYGYIFTAPFIIGFLLFSLYPLVYTFYLSLTDMTLMSKSYKFIGLANFKKLFEDRFFIQSFLNTWKIWLINFIPQLGIAMLLAVWFTSTRLKIKFVGFWRTIYYLPNILMPATIAVLFFNLFSYYGPVNQIGVRIGLFKDAIDFFRSSTWTVGIVAFIQWWMWFGTTLIIIMAGMTSISPSFYESAMVDGANSWQMFTKITLPLLRPVLVYILVTSLVGGMQMFDIPYMLTDGRGSPNGSIMTMNILMYMKFSSNKGHIGAAASVGVMIFLVTCISALIIIKLLKEKESKREIKSINRGVKAYELHG